MRSKGLAKSARDFALTAAENSGMARGVLTCTEKCAPGLLQNSCVQAARFHPNGTATGADIETFPVKGEARLRFVLHAQ